MERSGWTHSAARASITCGSNVVSCMCLKVPTSDVTAISTCKHYKWFSAQPSSPDMYSDSHSLPRPPFSHGSDVPTAEAFRPITLQSYQACRHCGRRMLGRHPGLVVDKHLSCPDVSLINVKAPFNTFQYLAVQPTKRWGDYHAHMSSAVNGIRQRLASSPPICAQYRHRLSLFLFRSFGTINKGVTADAAEYTRCAAHLKTLRRKAHALWRIRRMLVAPEGAR
jgi:hypothetical protein